MPTPPQLKGPLSPIPLADDTVWVTKDGEWVIVGRRTWDRKLGSPSASGSSGAVPPRPRPRTADDMGLVMGTGGSMPPAPSAPPPGKRTEPVLVQGRDTARLGLIAAGIVLGVVLVLALGVAVGMGIHRSAEPPAEPVPVLQPVELTRPQPPDVKPVFRTPPPTPVAADEEDTGAAARPTTGTSVLLGRELDDASAKPNAPTFLVPALPEAPPGETPHWLVRLTTGWRSLGPNPERAAKQFRRVAAARPKLPDGHLGLGVALIRLGHPDQAVDPLCTASSLSPDYAALAKGPLDAIGARCP